MELDRLEKRIRALQARKAARAATFERVQGIDPTEHEAAVYHAIHEDIAADAHTYYNLPGGRGSCKSSFVSLEIVDGIQSDPTGQSNAIVFRRVAGTMRDSVFSQIAWAIDLLGVSHLWKPTVSPMAYEYLPTGAQILFRGLDDASKLKSIKPRHGFFRFVWFEEFAELPGPQFARNVLQSVIRGHNAKPMVFRSFNPPMSMSIWALLPAQVWKYSRHWKCGRSPPKKSRIWNISSTAWILVLPLIRRASFGAAMTGSMKPFTC